MADEQTNEIRVGGRAWDRAWQIELKAEELFKADYPTGSFARRLPQFRQSAPDPVGDYYRRLAADALREELPVSAATPSHGSSSDTPLRGATVRSFAFDLKPIRPQIPKVAALFK